MPEAATRPKAPAPPTMIGRKNWMTETPRLPPAALRPEGGALLVGGVERVDVGHRGGEVAAAESGGGRDRDERPVRRGRVLHGVDEQQRGDQQQQRARDRPVAAAELRDREGVGHPDQGADQVGCRDEQEELLGGEVEAGGQQQSRRDAPDQPDREAEVLGEDRPDEVAAGDLPAASLPEGGVVGAPVVDPATGASPGGFLGPARGRSWGCRGGWPLVVLLRR